MLRTVLYIIFRTTFQADAYYIHFTDEKIEGRLRDLPSDIAARWQGQNSSTGCLPNPCSNPPTWGWGGFRALCFLLKLPNSSLYFISTLSICCCWVTQSCLSLCDPLDCSTPGFPVHRQLPELAQNPLSRRHHPTISSSVLLLLLPSVFPSIKVFSNESVLRISWPEYLSFSFGWSNCINYL